MNFELFRNIVKNASDVEKLLISCEKKYSKIVNFTDRETYSKKLAQLADGIVAIESNKWVGACIGYFNNKETKQAYISFLCNLDENNKGLGFLMHQKFCEKAIENGMESILLEVLKENARALRFYERLGYKIVEDHEKRWLMKKVFQTL